jgi:hypothetical protein
MNRRDFVSLIGAAAAVALFPERQRAYSFLPATWGDAIVLDPELELSQALSHFEHFLHDLSTTAKHLAGRTHFPGGVTISRGYMRGAERSHGLMSWSLEEYSYVRRCCDEVVKALPPHRPTRHAEYCAIQAATERKLAHLPRVMGVDMVGRQWRDWLKFRNDSGPASTGRV